LKLIKGDLPVDNTQKAITVLIKRQDPGCGKTSWISEYKVPRHRARRVLDLLEFIQEEVDPTLGWRTTICRDTCCSGCWIMVDGRKRMACLTVIKEDQDNILLEPITNYALIRDLVVDFSNEV
jgi:succinate dehydrogenase/fumarate reductase-like Fe-S protein